MSRVVLMCGPSGAGKTTYAHGLEREGMVRLSFDQVMWAARYVDHVEPPTEDEGPLTIVR